MQMMMMDVTPYPRLREERGWYNIQFLVEVGGDGGIPHICHRHHRRCLCKIFLPGVIFFQIEREKLAFYYIVYNNLRPSV